MMHEQAARHEAVTSELQSLSNLHVYEEAHLPPGQKAIGCRWVFRMKQDIEGQIKCRARLVAQGFGQHALDVDGFFAHVKK